MNYYTKHPKSPGPFSPKYGVKCPEYEVEEILESVIKAAILYSCV